MNIKCLGHYIYVLITFFNGSPFDCIKKQIVVIHGSTKSTGIFTCAT